MSPTLDMCVGCALDPRHIGYGYGAGTDRPAVHGALATPPGPVNQAGLLEIGGGHKADIALWPVREPVVAHLHVRPRPYRPTVSRPVRTSLDAIPRLKPGVVSIERSH